MKNKVTGHGWIFIATIILSGIAIVVLNNLPEEPQYQEPQVESREQGQVKSSLPDSMESEPLSKIEAYTDLINALKDFGLAWSPILAPVVVWYTQRKKKYIKDSEA